MYKMFSELVNALSSTLGPYTPMITAAITPRLRMNPSHHIKRLDEEHITHRNPSSTPSPLASSPRQDDDTFFSPSPSRTGRINGACPSLVDPRPPCLPSWPHSAPW